MSTPKDDAIIPIEWLLGKWKSVTAEVFYPTIKTVQYTEDMEFSHRGQADLIYCSVTNHAEKGIPLHSERGYLSINPGTNNLALLVAHHFGMTEISEGEVNGHTVTLESTSLNRMPFTLGSVVTKVTRKLELVDENTLTNVIFMATENQPLQEHLHSTFKRL